MTLFKFILTFALFPLLTTGQKLNGTYRSGIEYIRFNNDTATFLFTTGGCLVYQFEAMGNYTIDKNHLVIHPYIDTPINNITKTKRYDDDSVSIEVIISGGELAFPSLTIYDDRKKAIAGKALTPNKGEVLRYSNTMMVDSIKIANVNYITVGLKIDKGYDYKIALQQGKIKSDYEQFLNSNDNGFKIKIKKDRLLLYRPEYSCKDSNHFWQTFVFN